MKKNHGKVFEENYGKISLWKPIKDEVYKVFVSNNNNVPATTIKKNKMMKDENKIQRIGGLKDGSWEVVGNDEGSVI